MVQKCCSSIDFICIYKGNPLKPRDPPALQPGKITPENPGQHRPSADEVARADASFRSEKVKVL